MLTLLLCLISFTRSAIVYFSGKILSGMERRSSLSSTSPCQPDSNKLLAPDFSDSDSKEKRTKVKRNSVSGLDMPFRFPHRSTSVIDGSDDTIPVSIKPIRRTKSVSTEDVSSDECCNTGTDVIENPRVEDSKHVHMTDAVPNVPPVDDDRFLNSPSTIIGIPVTKDDMRYNMDHKNRGKCIIFNHESFESDQTARFGTTTDAVRLQKTFKNLGFAVEVHSDLLFSDVMGKIKELSEQNHEENDCICIFILTHGLGNGLLHAKDAAYRHEQIWKPFTADKCPSLAGKPKLFFFQACRGEKLDGGVVVSRSAERTETDSSISTYKIPTHADFLIAHSTVQGFVSWRDPEEGTWYVQRLCDVIDQYWETKDLLSILTITARRVATDHISYNDINPAKHNQTQIPSVTSMLIRDLYFSPKRNQRDKR